jgi:hypothetical protein
MPTAQDLIAAVRNDVLSAAARLPPMMMDGGPFGLFFLVFVNRYRVEIFRFEHLIAFKTANVVDAIAPVQKFSSLVLTAWHSEIFPILVSSA